jgi:hypothetical protein
MLLRLHFLSVLTSLMLAYQIIMLSVGGLTAAPRQRRRALVHNLNSFALGVIWTWRPFASLYLSRDFASLRCGQLELMNYADCTMANYGRFLISWFHCVRLPFGGDRLIRGSTANVGPPNV